MSHEVEMKRCAHCGQWVPIEVTMCAACGTSDVDGARARQAGALPPRARPRQPRPGWNVTTALLIANFAYLLWMLRVQFAYTPEQGVFESMVSLSGLNESMPGSGAYIHGYVVRGQWWRLFTATFMHAGLLHIGMNMYVLMQIGRVLEDLLGAARFLTVYLVSALGSTAAISIWYVHIMGATRTPMMVGASGAVFGALGCLAVYALRSPRGRGIGMRLARDLVFMLLIGWFVPMVSNVGHVGGLLPGLVFGAFVGERFSDRLRSDGGRIWIASATVLSLVALYALGQGVLFSVETLGGK